MEKQQRTAEITPNYVSLNCLAKQLPGRANRNRHSRRIRIQSFIHIQPFCKNVFFSLIKSLKILSMYIIRFLYSSYNKKDPKLDPHYCESADLD